MLGLWYFSPLRKYLEVDILVAWAERFRESPLSWFYILLAYIVGGLICCPVTLMIVATSALLSPLPAFFCSYGSALVSASLTYALGHWLGHDTIQSVTDGRLNKLSRRIARRGLITVGALRLMPIAPFTFINLAAGASHIRFRDYLLGTMLGMLPGIAGLTLLTERFKATLVEPGPWNILLFILLLVTFGWGAYYLRKKLGKPN